MCIRDSSSTVRAFFVISMIGRRPFLSIPRRPIVRAAGMCYTDRTRAAAFASLLNLSVSYTHLDGDSHRQGCLRYL